MGPLFVVLALLWADGPARGESPGQKPDILVITVDTLRPDALGWVSGKASTPNLDRFAGRGFRFSGAVSPAPLTAPAHATLMTGLLPRRHGVRDNGQLLGDIPTTLAEHLQDLGYSTAAVVSGYPLILSSGLGRGFESFDDRMDREMRGLERRGDHSTQAALEAAKSLASPYFLWVHYYDPHDPYEAPEDFGPGYAGEVRFVDEMIGRLLEGLDLSDRSPDITVFAADHGESLGEHEESTHGFFLYESTMAVPVVFHGPDRIEPGQSAAPFRIQDVAPTLLSVANLPPLSGEIDGVDLIDLLKGREVDVPPAYLESRRPWRSYRWAPLSAIRDGDWKLIAAPRPELYDLGSDPDEKRNLIRHERETAYRLRQELRRVEARKAVEAETADRETLARLESLGYVGGRGSSEATTPRDLPDPKDRIQLWNLLGDALAAVEKGDLATGIALFDKVLANEPDNPFALSRSGSALLAAGDAKGAVPRLERAARVTPDDPLVHQRLAQAWAALGEREREIDSLFEAARYSGGSANAWARLAKALGQAGRPSEAIGALSRAVELDDRRVDLLTQLAFAEYSVGDPHGASLHLQRVAELEGEQFAHPAVLGLMFVEDGRVEEARRWLEIAGREEKEYGRARLALARILLAQGDRAGAERAVREAIEVEPALESTVREDASLEGVMGGGHG